MAAGSRARRFLPVKVSAPQRSRLLSLSVQKRASWQPGSLPLSRFALLPLCCLTGSERQSEDGQRRSYRQAPTLMLQQTEVFDLDPSAIAPKGIDVEKDPGYKA